MIRLPLVLSEDEFKRLLVVTSRFHHRLAFLLGFYEGLRVSEVVRLLPGDVDFGQRIIRVRQGKGGKDRNIPINPFIWKDLSKAVKTGVLPIKCGVRALERVFKRNLLKSGVGKELHFHNLRHSSGTYYLSKGWDSRMIQRLLGHSRLDTTQIYVLVSPEDLVKKMWEEK